jgi:hypothetical protein
VYSSIEQESWHAESFPIPNHALNLEVLLVMATRETLIKFSAFHSHSLGLYNVGGPRSIQLSLRLRF